MDFTFSEEQEALRTGARDFLRAESPPAYWRAMLEDDHGFTPEIWNRLGELGWTGLLIPEAYGGLGLGMVDLVVIMEEMGRVPFPGPFFSSAVFTTLAARALELEDQLRQLASGESRGCVALEENGHGDVVGRIRTRASRKSGRWRLSGEKSVVVDGHTADYALVAARTQAGMGTFLIENPQAQLIPSWDGTRKLATLSLEDTPAEPIGPEGDHSALWRRVVDDACIALCAELVGACERSSDLAVEYAKQRVQFGRPIATFQVIKHKTVDMLHKLELARVGTHYAAWASDTHDPLREEATAMAKAFVPEAANFITGESIQIHGGIGFTWEADPHVFYRKAKQNDLLLGYHGTHRGRVADLFLERT